MNRKWYPYGEGQPITMEILVEALELVWPKEFTSHGKVVEVINYYHDYGYFLRFEDGSLSVPIESRGRSCSHVYKDEFFELGILKPEHLKEIKAEEDAIRAKEEEKTKQRRKKTIISQACSEQTQAKKDRLFEIESAISGFRRFTNLKQKELISLYTEACKLGAEIAQIYELPPEKLLTPEEFEKYNSL